MEYGRIDHANIRIPENGVERCLEFYRDRLGFRPEKLDKYREGERTSFAFRISDRAMLHIRPVEKFERPDDTGFDHFCIRMEGSVDELKQLLDEESVEREGNPWGSEGRAPAVYVRDPFGYLIEFKQKQ